METPVKPAPAEAKKPCPEPPLFKDTVPKDEFAALDGEGKYNAVLSYVVEHVYAALGECNTRHNALIEHQKEVEAE